MALDPGVLLSEPPGLGALGPQLGHVRIVPCQQWGPHVQRIAPTQVLVPLLDLGVKPHPRAKLATKHCLIATVSGVWGNGTSTQEERLLLCRGRDSFKAPHEGPVFIEDP